MQLYAKLQEDVKGTEDEADGKVWYKFACLHKVSKLHPSCLCLIIMFYILDPFTLVSSISLCNYSEDPEKYCL